MKSVAHAWVALMALERLKRLPKAGSRKNGFITAHYPGLYLGNQFDAHFQAQADSFVALFDKHKDSFLKGAWFPDSVIADNLVGGHTFKLKRPETAEEKKMAVPFANRLPKFMSQPADLGIKAARLEEKVFRLEDYTLPDRVEALTHTLRDMVLIQKDQPKGSDIMFNDDQLTLYFLMLSHYVADAHVPPHSDARDFYGPSTVHPDMEGFWDDEVLKYFEFDRARGVFDYDIDGAPELLEDAAKRTVFKGSVLHKALAICGSRQWPLKYTKSGPMTPAVIGEGNKKIYDLIKAICFSSYLISTDYVPYSVDAVTYKKLKILKDPKYKAGLEAISPAILANAIDAIALIWLLTWDKYSQLKEQIKEKGEAIAKEGTVG